MKFHKIGTILMAIALLSIFIATPSQAWGTKEGILKKVEYLGNGDAMLTVKVSGGIEIWRTTKDEFELPEELTLGRKILKKKNLRTARGSKYWVIEQ
jgi:hypothetical protein